ncbi:MAG: glycosyltransferase family 2 protein [Cenarchaeum sp. SB0663_bin_5]|nr:glycosyltransferase family 2 protein [Cenarchaeum sp. SB0663_bin_5]MYH03953.1 glycosyltransferase family 2 protein [Cenarchaeum sp. SB0675_bin_21]
MTGTYYTFMPVRNTEKSIQAVIDSLLEQTLPPKEIIVVNDGSTDKTGDILREYQNSAPVKIITTDSKTRDYTRLVRLWNMCLQRDYDYHMVSPGDTIFQKDYAEIIVNAMDKDSKLVIASGNLQTEKAGDPRGAGRFVQQNFFYKFYKKYPEIVGYESEILFKAQIHGYKVFVFDAARFEHVDKLGHKHNFVDFGQGMKAIGYHPLFVLGRTLNEIKKNGDMGRKGAINMLWNYIKYRPEREGYFSLFPQDDRERVRSMQKRRMWQYVKDAFTRFKE